MLQSSTFSSALLKGRSVVVSAAKRQLCLAPQIASFHTAMSPRGVLCFFLNVFVFVSPAVVSAVTYYFYVLQSNCFPGTTAPMVGRLTDLNTCLPVYSLTFSCYNRGTSSVIDVVIGYRSIWQSTAIHCTFIQYYIGIHLIVRKLLIR